MPVSFKQLWQNICLMGICFAQESEKQECKQTGVLHLGSFRLGRSCNQPLNKQSRYPGLMLSVQRGSAGRLHKSNVPRSDWCWGAYRDAIPCFNSLAGWFSCVHLCMKLAELPLLKPPGHGSFIHYCNYYQKVSFGYVVLKVNPICKQADSDSVVSPELSWDAKHHSTSSNASIIPVLKILTFLWQHCLWTTSSIHTTVVHMPYVHNTFSLVDTTSLKQGNEQCYVNVPCSGLVIQYLTRDSNYYWVKLVLRRHAA